jgi:hypothetical protein
VPNEIDYVFVWCQWLVDCRIASDLFHASYDNQRRREILLDFAVRPRFGGVGAPDKVRFWSFSAAVRLATPTYCIGQRLKGMDGTEVMQDGLAFTSSQLPAGLCDEVETVRSELKHTKATIAKSISETIVAVDDLGEKHHTFESQVNENISLIHSKLDKLSRAQVQQVWTIAFLNIFTYLLLVGSKDRAMCMPFLQSH